MLLLVFNTGFLAATDVLGVAAESVILLAFMAMSGRKSLTEPGRRDLVNPHHRQWALTPTCGLRTHPRRMEPCQSAASAEMRVSTQLFDHYRYPSKRLTFPRRFGIFWQPAHDRGFAITLVVGWSRISSRGLVSKKYFPVSLAKMDRPVRN